MRLFKSIPNAHIGRIACLSLVLLQALSCNSESAQRLESARTAVARADEQNELADAVLAAGKENEAAEHFRSARNLIVDAREFYLEARAHESADADLLQEFAALCVRSEDFDLAAKAYRRAAQFEPEKTEHWLHAGQNFVRVGRSMTKDALESLNLCIARANEAEDTKLAARASAELGNLYRKLALYELSRQFYESALISDPDNTIARIGLVGLHFREGNVLEAADYADRLGRLGGDEGIFLDAMVRFGSKGFHDTRSFFSDSAENHMAYAKLLTRIGRLEEGLFALERVVELDETNVIALNMLGSLAVASGDITRARDAFTRSLEKNPDQPRTREALDGLQGPSQ